MLQLENKVYEMRLESEINDIIYDCKDYLCEAEEVKSQTPAQKEKKLGLIERIINGIKKIIDKIKSFFKSDTDKAVSEYKENAPSQGIPQADSAGKRLITFVQKENPTKNEIEQAEKDTNMLKDIIDKLKNNKKKIAKTVIMGGPILYSLYWKLHGAQKCAEKDDKEISKLHTRIENGETVTDEEIDKATNKLRRANIIKVITSYVGYICHHVFIVGSARKVYKTVSNKTGNKVAGGAAGVGSLLAMRQTLGATSPNLTSSYPALSATRYKNDLKNKRDMYDNSHNVSNKNEDDDYIEIIDPSVDDVADLLDSDGHRKV